MSDTSAYDEGLIVGYKSGQAVDCSVVYAPYVPLQFTSASPSTADYWHATELHANDHPLVVIDGTYLALKSKIIRDIVEKWLASHAQQGFYWETNKGFDLGRPSPFSQIDIVRFLNIEDAMLFKIAFSERQYFR